MKYLHKSRFAENSPNDKIEEDQLFPMHFHFRFAVHFSRSQILFFNFDYVSSQLHAFFSVSICKSHVNEPKFTSMLSYINGLLCVCFVGRYPLPTHMEMIENLSSIFGMLITMSCYCHTIVLLISL